MTSIYRSSHIHMRSHFDKEDLLFLFWNPLKITEILLWVINHWKIKFWLIRKNFKSHTTELLENNNKIASSMIVPLHNSNKSNKTVKISPFPPFFYLFKCYILCKKRTTIPNASTRFLSFPPSQHNIGQNTSIFTPYYQTTHIQYTYCVCIANKWYNKRRE